MNAKPKANNKKREDIREIIIRGLTQEKADLERANREIQELTNAVTISIILACGEKQEDGTVSVTIPKIDVREINRRYAIRANVDGDTRIITVEPKEEA